MKLNQPTAILILSAFLFTTSASSQTTTSANKDSITIVKNFWGIKYYQGNTKLNMAGVSSALKSDAGAYATWKSGKSRYIIAQIFGAIGGALVGYEIGKNLGGGGKINTTVISIGGAMVVSSIIFGINGEKKMKRGIRLYNATLY
jgi:hypothetical protein